MLIWVVFALSAAATNPVSQIGCTSDVSKQCHVSKQEQMKTLGVAVQCAALRMFETL